MYFVMNIFSYLAYFRIYEHSEQDDDGGTTKEDIFNTYRNELDHGEN